MDEQKIVKRVILKAREYGFDFKQIWCGLPDDYKWEVWSGDRKIHFYNDGNSFRSGSNDGWNMAYETLFFYHGFINAFAKYIIASGQNKWGKDIIAGDTISFVAYKLLVNLAIERDRVRYLESYYIKEE
jgi:hypothetical protein